MKILIIHPRLDYYGGAELVVVKLANYLESKENFVNVLTLSISDEIEKDLKVPVINQQMKFDDGIFGMIGQIDILNMCIRDIEKIYDVINIHNFPAELAMRKTNTPSVWYCNEPPTYWLNPEAKFQLPHKLLLRSEKRIVKKYINKACVADEFNAKRFKERYDFNPEIIPYGIDYDFFSQGDGKKTNEAYSLQDKFVVLQVGMITPQKNQMRSIRAIEVLKEKIPNIKLVLAGDYNTYYGVELIKYVENRNLTKNIIFTSHITRDKLRSLYHACDVLIHPVKSQGGWLAPFECMCADKPVVVSREFTASNIIRQEEIGIVTDEYEKAITFVHDKSNYDTEKGKMYVKENLTWEKFGERMLEVFEEIKRK